MNSYSSAQTRQPTLATSVPVGRPLIAELNCRPTSRANRPERLPIGSSALQARIGGGHHIGRGSSAVWNGWSVSNASSGWVFTSH